MGFAVGDRVRVVSDVGAKYLPCGSESVVVDVDLVGEPPIVLVACGDSAIVFGPSDLVVIR